MAIKFSLVRYSGEAIKAVWLDIAGSAWLCLKDVYYALLNEREIVCSYSTLRRRIPVSKLRLENHRKFLTNPNVVCDQDIKDYVTSGLVCYVRADVFINESRVLDLLNIHSKFPEWAASPDLHFWYSDKPGKVINNLTAEATLKEVRKLVGAATERMRTTTILILLKELEASVNTKIKEIRYVLGEIND